MTTTTTKPAARLRRGGGLSLPLFLVALVASPLSLAPPVRGFDAVIPEDGDLPDEDYPAEAIIETDEAIHVPFQSRKQILSLGGNGMIGASVLSKLIAAGEYDITLASRGSWPYDSSRLIKPHVKHVRCDRSDRPVCPDEEDDPEGWEDCDDNGWRHSCPELVEAVRVSDDYWAVLDFSGYRGSWVQDAVDELGDQVRVYVYVSTDSVYEVSRMGGPGPSYYRMTGKRITEDMAVRPEDEEQAYWLAEWDEYGHHKLEGEEVLRWQREEEDTEGDDEDETWDGFPYVALRFADVVGPRDNTGRYATYHVWARYVGRVEGIPPFHIEEDVVEATSVTYVEDAAQAILKAIDTPDAWDEVYNVASEEVFNATEMLPLLGEIMGRDPALLGVEKRPNDESFSAFPSVTRGPLDVSKARAKLGFQPTPLRKVLEETVAWYDEMFLLNEEVREEMVKEFMDVLDDEEDEEVIQRLWEAINEDVKVAKELRAEKIHDEKMRERDKKREGMTAEEEL